MLNYILMSIGVYFIIFSFVLKTRNFLSTVIFKLIPFFSGVFNIGYALNQIGIIAVIGIGG